jgi:hypothetical protein
MTWEEIKVTPLWRNEHASRDGAERFNSPLVYIKRVEDMVPSKLSLLQHSPQTRNFSRNNCPVWILDQAGGRLARRALPSRTVRVPQATTTSLACRMLMEYYSLRQNFALISLFNLQD